MFGECVLEVECSIMVLLSSINQSFRNLTCSIRSAAVPAWTRAPPVWRSCNSGVQRLVHGTGRGLGTTKKWLGRGIELVGS